MAIYVGDKRYAPYIGDKRRRYMGGGSSLPYDAEIEYLEVGSSVGPYINTGYAWTSNDIEIDIQLMHTGSGNANTGLFGSQKVGIDTNWGIQYWHSQAGYSIRHYIGRSASVYSWNATQNTIHHFIGKVNSDYTWKITIDGADHTGTWQGTVCDNVTNVALFTLSNGSDFTSRRTNNVRVYSFKLTDNGVTVRDMIPVRIGQVGYMYDRISQQLFGNAGTGDFVLGPDKITKNYLCFEAIEAGTFSFTNNVEYSLDRNTWVALAANTPTPEISAGGLIYWRGNITPSNANGSGTFSSTGTFNASGDPQSLNYADTFDSVDTYLMFEFLKLFSSSKIVHAGGLDLGKSDTMASYCCQAMFLSCTSLVEAPILPALTTSANSYAQMFRYCSSLNYIKAMFLTNTGLYAWVQNVSRTGTFVKNKDATWTDVGQHGVPSGWTIIYE